MRRGWGVGAVVALGVVLAAGAGEARAELVWRAREVSYAAEPGETEARLRFGFENRGRRVVTITQVLPECGCTGVGLEKRRYAEGERGEIDVRFVFGNRLGEQVKTITVRTDDPAEPGTVLTLRVKIPKIATLSPTAVWWKPEEARAGVAKRAELAVLADKPVRITKVESSHPGVKWRVETVEEGWRYRIAVDPPAAEAGSVEYLTITTDYPGQRAVTYRLMVKR